jgi:3-oxoacyl-[acyl-carrier protein] reductase
MRQRGRPGSDRDRPVPQGKPQEVLEHLAKLAPLERPGRPADIAAVVSFLAGRDGGWVNGQVLRANGGII